MRGWDWLTKTPFTLGFFARVLIKAAALFVLINLVFALVDPIPALGRVSIYNTLVPGRARLPYGENPASYNLSLNSIDAMIASHEVNIMSEGDFNVWIFGDSSVWGILLDNDETLTGSLNATNIQIEGQRVRTYNLGHPILSVTKDLLLIDTLRAREQPDLIIWLITLDSMVYADQLEPPLLRNNESLVRDLIRAYDLPLDAGSVEWASQTWFDRTLVGQRRTLADWFRVQLYGIAWANTGLDQVHNEYTPRANDFEQDFSWSSYTEPAELPPDQLAFDVLDRGHAAARGVPVLLINEPIYIADGTNSDIRYNAWYPRWAYDQWRTLLADQAQTRGWNLLDLWDEIPSSEFTDSPVHLTPSGSRQLSARIASAIMEYAQAIGD